MSMHPASRQRIRERARVLCEYCHSSEEASAARFTFDHLIPQSLGGGDEEDNLALACHRCNGRRYTFTDGVDPVTQTRVPLFHPRRERWAEHFVWSADGQTIIGTTPTGRATVQRLDMNDDWHHDGAIKRARRLWIRGGWHPPPDDPREPIA